MAKKNRDPFPNEDDLFEGANHVLRGLHQQLTFWKTQEGNPDQETMVPALTKAAAALRDGLQAAKARAEG
jgi:hypothetical protein